MDITRLLTEIRRRLNLSRPELSKQLGFKSLSYVWLLEEKQRKPSIAACKVIIKFARDRAGIGVTFAMLRDDMK